MKLSRSMIAPDPRGRRETPLRSYRSYRLKGWCIGIENLTIVLRWCSQPSDVPHLGKRERTAK